MAALFEVETGTGSATANAYCTVAEADQYHEDYEEDEGAPLTSWYEVADAQKKTAIRIATRYIDAVYGRRWKGIPSFAGQRLDWPQTDVEIKPGFYLEHNEIPRQLKDACAVLALKHIQSSAGLLPSLEAETGTVKSVRSGIGPLQDAIEYLGGSREAPSYPIVDGILAPLLIGGGSVGVIRRA